MAKSPTTAVKTDEPKVEVSKFDHFKAIGIDKLLEQHKTRSGVIRFLDSEGLKRGEIAKIVDRKYQHVRNVLVTPIGKANTTSTAE